MKTFAEQVAEAVVRLAHYQARFVANGGSVPLPPCPVHGPGGCWEPS